MAAFNESTDRDCSVGFTNQLKTQVKYLTKEYRFLQLKMKIYTLHTYTY